MSGGASAEHSGSSAVGRSVFLNAVVGLGGQVLIKLFSFAFGIYCVRKLGDVAYGRYAAALAYVGSVAMLTDLGTSTFSLREMARAKQAMSHIVPDLQSLRALLSAVVVVALTLAVWALGKPPEIVLGVCIASCGLLLYAVQGPLETAMIAAERLDLRAAVTVLNQAVFILCALVALLSGAGYIGLLAASLVGVLAMTLASRYVVRTALRVQFDRPNRARWPGLLRASWPFGVSGAAGEFAARFDTIFLSFTLTDAAVGWYNAPYTLIVSPLLLAQNFGTALQPVLIRQHHSENGVVGASVRRAVRYVLLASVPLAIGGAVLADHIIVTLYGQSFAPAIPVMRVLICLLPMQFVLEILGRAAIALHLERAMMRVNAVGAVVGVVLVAVCVPTFGVIGAAVAAVVARATVLALTSAAIGRETLWRNNEEPLLAVVGAGIIMGGVLLVLRAPLFSAIGNEALVLGALLIAGVVTYAVAAVVVGAVTAPEIRALLTMTQRR